jgi:hypothetical protein
MIGSQSFVGSSVEIRKEKRTYSTAVLVIVAAAVLVVVRHDGCV